MLPTRLWTAAVALPLIVALLIFAPSGLWTLFVAASSAWGIYEVLEINKVQGLLPGAVVVLAGLPVKLLLRPGTPAFPLVAVVVALTMCALIVQLQFAPHSAAGLTDKPAAFPRALLGAIYVGTLFPYFALLRNARGGVELMVVMLLIVVAGDSGAYFSGRALGRHKLASRVSPGKTVEGALGGLLAAVAAGLVLAPLVGLKWPALRVAAFAAGLGVVEQLGDLAESAYKRICGVKDSGWLFPGHGGLLDRTDSLVFAALFAYYYGR